ncbi:MAG: ABC transporter substrate-binding protein [Bifidobacteriaceae bacterium]|jgi:peptide/nickel transport system substrate-binding protein|nr:ABC transporter substrate-binding protein [Bifidobacteriaceae bacterium]
MSNRSRVVALLTAAALTLTLAACGSKGSDQDNPAGEAGKPVEGGTLYWAIETQLQTVNPHLNGQDKAVPVLRNAFDSYLYLNEKGEYEPWLAESYQVSEDGLKHTLVLRDGITFSDGEALTADASKANFDKILSETYGSSTPGGLRYLDSINKIDDRTLEFTLTKPDALFSQYLASAGATPLSPASLKLDQTVLESGGPELAGVGPFVITSYTPNTELTFKKRDDYAWAPESVAKGQKAAHLDSVVVRTFPEGATRTGALQQGQVQVSSDIQPLDVPVFEDQKGFQYIRTYVAGTPYALYLNVSKPPLDDVRVRQAFILGSDLDAIIESVYQGAYDRAWAPVSVRGPWADKSLEGWSATDIDKANELLDQAGWTERDADGIRVKDGQTLTVRTVTEAPFVRESREQVNLAISAALKENVGIDYKYEIVDMGSGTERVAANEYEGFDNSYGGADPAAGLDLLYHSDPARGFIARGKFKDPKVDELIDAGRFSTNLDDRLKAYTEFQKYVTEEKFYVLPIYQTQDSVAATDKVKNVFIDAKGQPFGAYTIWLVP